MIIKKLKKTKINNTTTDNNIKCKINEDIDAEDGEYNIIYKHIDENKKILQKKFQNSVDFNMFEIKTEGGLELLVVFLDELVKNEILDRDVINHLITNSSITGSIKDLEPDEIRKLFPVSDVKEVKKMYEIIDSILDGDAVFFIDDLCKAYAVSSRGWNKRAIEEPSSESVIRGPKEGFIESINVNRSLIRRKIKNVNLIIEEIKIGRQTKTTINIVYISGIANISILKELKRRLNEIDTDAILDAGYIEAFIEDSHTSPFSTIGYTQKPDVVAGKVLEGRIAVLCDGSPHVLTVPHLLVESLQSSEDYYIRPYIASFLRLTRVLSVFISILLPAFYVALLTYHQEMIPTVLLITMSGAHEGRPLPSFVEALIMVLAFEFLKESGTRLPRAVGSAISIVGALVLGDAAVSAGIISADMIIVIAFTAVCTFIVPSLNEVITLYRFIFLVLAAIIGIYGITAGTFVMIVHISSLRSFGVPFLSPIQPLNTEGLKDTAIRFPIWSMNRRPLSIVKRNFKRVFQRKRVK